MGNCQGTPEKKRGRAAPNCMPGIANKHLCSHACSHAEPPQQLLVRPPEGEPGFVAVNVGHPVGAHDGLAGEAGRKLPRLADVAVAPLELDDGLCTHVLQEEESWKGASPSYDGTCNSQRPSPQLPLRPVDGIPQGCCPTLSALRRAARPCPSAPTALARIASSRLMLPSRRPIRIARHSRRSSAAACIFSFALSSLPPSCTSSPPSCCPSRGRDQPLIRGLQPLPEGPQPKATASARPWLTAAAAAPLLLAARPIALLSSPATALPLSEGVHHLDCVDDANAGHTLRAVPNNGQALHKPMGRPGGTPYLCEGR